MPEGFLYTNMKMEFASQTPSKNGKSLDIYYRGQPYFKYVTPPECHALFKFGNCFKFLFCFGGLQWVSVNFHGFQVDFIRFFLFPIYPNIDLNLQELFFII